MNIPPPLRYFAIAFVTIGLIGQTACRPAATPSALLPSPSDTISAATRIPTRQPTIEPAKKPTSQPSPQAASPSPTPEPVSDRALSLGMIGQPDTLNPVTGRAAILRELQPLLFDTLLSVDPQTAELRPGLAENWEYSADGRLVEFHLPANLHWSDGSTLDASAIVASVKATQHPALQAFSAIEAPNDHTLTLTFAAVDCAAVSAIAQLPLLPSDQITATMPVGSGPFVPQAWSADGRVLTLTPNPHYRGSTPRLAEITARFLAEGELEIALSEGNFDLIAPIPAQNFTAESGHFIDMVYPTAKMVFVAVNFAAKNGDTLPPAFHSILPLALNRDAILAEALADDGQLLAGSLLPSHWAANINLAQPPYNPAQARQMLAEAGLRDIDGDGWLDYQGQRLEIGIRVNGQNELHQNLGWLVSSYYRDLGLFARAETIPAESLLDDLFTHDFQAAIFSWPILAEPDSRQFWHSAEDTVGVGLNFMSYQNARVDKLLDEGLAVSGCAPAERAKIYQAVQSELDKERPVDFLLSPNQHLLTGASVRGVAPGPFAAFTWNAAEWYLLEEK
jgi:peptide/nickel transport system substrate-binding protein